MSKICQSYRSGHQTHWIPVLRVYAHTPRIPATIEPLESGGFEVSWIEAADGNGGSQRTEVRFWHDPKRLIAILAGSEGDFEIELVQDTEYLVIEQDKGGLWLNMSSEPITPCIFRGNSNG